jgi:hypothetical protein
MNTHSVVFVVDCNNYEGGEAIPETEDLLPREPGRRSNSRVFTIKEITFVCRDATR